MPSTATTITALAASAALLAYGATRLSSKSKEIAEIDDLDEDDFLTPEDVTSIFDKLFMQMQQVVLQLSQQVQQIQMSGQVIPEKQLRQLLKSEFERALQQLQAQVLEEADVDADCLEEATWEFIQEGEKYPKVKRAVERFQALYESVSGVECKGWHPNKGVESGGVKGGSKKELTAKELIEAANLYFDKITETMVSMANSYKLQGKNLKDPQVAQQYQMEASTDANEVAEKALEAKGISMSDFRSAIDKLSRVPSVGQTLGMLQLKQQQELMEAGVPMM
ncbi:hypothetical protein ACHAWO_002650 [Cyclotella atomus]|jgi:hypothetical protein|uniref:Uncharacterized protein n=1 Tax=Cyclotella atomus TaxID=382360 RepID=A0ABD3Q5K6_9STRA